MLEGASEAAGCSSMHVRHTLGRTVSSEGPHARPPEQARQAAPLPLKGRPFPSRWNSSRPFLFISHQTQRRNPGLPLRYPTNDTPSSFRFLLYSTSPYPHSSHNHTQSSLTLVLDLSQSNQLAYSPHPLASFLLLYKCPIRGSWKNKRISPLARSNQPAGPQSVSWIGFALFCFSLHSQASRLSIRQQITGRPLITLLVFASFFLFLFPCDCYISKKEKNHPGSHLSTITRPLHR
ncbi:hypothetical protein BO78DRAFT_82062 [Aspergillus sclerotiicarbonarius CBS 121057]|uniref:Uncharacterized protein n=1 Tax=Aspergillus sclerotiicarbonarius (strain CBS 121057 / IBT 28362) TaxID=1448318 RepID=A0A319EJV5_ASPSB|nr:hypothetical protein BO78DRAFT_82062 [Aspergillus sclerotiicarbonarius CBS 121057]